MKNSILHLIKKYDISGPRYTSYPPAPLFSKDFGAKQYREAIIATEQHPVHQNISLYVHFPFCDTLCYFCGCTTVITRNREHISRYLNYLKKEIDLLSPMLHHKRRVIQLHWGGGTPTYLTPAQIRELGGYIATSFSIDHDAEISVEIDPRDLTYEHLKALREVGFNRISLGAQDFNPRVQQAVNRHQSEFITRQAIAWSRELGFTSMNIDLIYGLPLQTVESFIETLDKIIDISPERIAVYNFAYVPWMKKHQKLIHQEDMPSPETKVGILATTIDKLSGAGYNYIGMDHFAKPNDELTVAQKNRTLNRNFHGYSTNAGSDLYGLGMSSIGHFNGYYAQNHKTLLEYYDAIEAGSFATHIGYRMTFDDEVRKYVIMRLMCDLQANKIEIEQKFGIDFDRYFAQSLTKLKQIIDDELVLSTSTHLVVTTVGRLFLRNIAMCFDAYLIDATQKQPLYSKTV